MPRIWIRGVTETVYGGHRYEFGPGWNEVQPWNMSLSDALYEELAQDLALHALAKSGHSPSPENYHEGDVAPEAEVVVESSAPEPEPKPEEPIKPRRRKGN